MPHIHSPARANARRLLAVLGLSIGILVIELVGGLASNSLALLADAGHVFTDVAGLSLALLAIWFGSRPTSSERTFGYLRLEILAAVANAVLLFAVAAFILYEAWRRLSDPPEVASGLMLAVAVVGLAGQRHLAVAAPRRPGAGASRCAAPISRWPATRRAPWRSIVAAVVIAVTGRTGADALASALIALLILPRTWGLLRDAIDVLLEATPKGVEMADVRRHILDAPGVADVHDLHAWSITSGVNVVSAHVVLEPGAEPAGVLDFLCECLSGDFDIEHSTFQLESSDRRRLEAGSHG